MEVIAAYFMVFFRHVPGGTEKEYDKSSVRIAGFRAEIQSGDPWSPELVCIFWLIILNFKVAGETPWRKRRVFHCAQQRVVQLTDRLSPSYPCSRLFKPRLFLMVFFSPSNRMPV